MLTIAIPTYNRKKQLIRTLNCLKEQTNQKFSIVISDNNSNYDINKVIDEHFDSDFKNKIKVIRRKVNVGGDNNIVGMFEIVTDGWLWIVGDDDYEYDDSVDKIYRYINMYNHCDVIQFVYHDYIKENIVLDNLKSFIEIFYENTNKRTAESVWGEFANLMNKVYNVKNLNNAISLGMQYSNCAMTTGIVLLGALMDDKKVAFIRDEIHIQSPGEWNTKRVSLASSEIANIDYDISYDLRKKLLYVINFPYRVPLHYWLLPENHYDEDKYIERLYYGFYRYHLPLKERLDYWFRMKVFSIDLVYRFHLWIVNIERKFRKTKGDNK